MCMKDKTPTKAVVILTDDTAVRAFCTTGILALPVLAIGEVLSDG